MRWCCLSIEGELNCLRRVRFIELWCGLLLSPRLNGVQETNDHGDKNN